MREAWLKFGRLWLKQGHRGCNCLMSDEASCGTAPPVMDDGNGDGPPRLPVMVCVWCRRRRSSVAGTASLRMRSGWTWRAAGPWPRRWVGSSGEGKRSADSVALAVPGVIELLGIVVLGTGLGADQGYVCRRLAVVPSSLSSGGRGGGGAAPAPHPPTAPQDPAVSGWVPQAYGRPA